MHIYVFLPQQVLLPHKLIIYKNQYKSDRRAWEQKVIKDGCPTYDPIYLILLSVLRHQVPTAPRNAPVGSEASYVYIRSVRNGTWPNTTVLSSSNSSWDFTVIEADICASNDFSTTRQSVIHISNPLIWWTDNHCTAQGWAPCTPYSFYTYNNWVSIEWNTWIWQPIVSAVSLAVFKYVDRLR